MSVASHERERPQSNVTVLDIVGLVVVAAPLAVGSVHVETQLALAAVAAVMMARVWLRPTANLPTLHVIGWTALVWLVLSLLALIPMPAEIVAALSEQAAETYATTASLTGVETQASLSPDRGRSANVLLTLVIYGLISATVWGAAHEAASRSGVLARIPLYVLFAGGVSVLVAMAHTALAANSLYGLYMPVASLSTQPLRGPMVNSNHTAALLLLTSCVTFGVWLRTREYRRGMLLASVWTVMVAGIVISGSRANLGLLIVTHGYLFWRIGRGNAESRMRLFWITAGAFVLTGTATLGFGVNWWEFLQDTSHGDAGLLNTNLIKRWETGWHVMLERPWFGHGPGIFGVISPRHTASWLPHYSYMERAHNLPLQLATEWGIPIALVLLAVGGRWLARLMKQTYKRPAEHAAAVGLLAVACQNMVDFSLLVPGVGVAWIATATWLSATRLGDVSRSSWSWSRTLATLALISVLGPLGFMSYHGDLGRADAALRAAAPTETWRNVVNRTLTEHPADFHLHTLSSAIARTQGDAELAHRLGQRALTLAPSAPSVLEEAAKSAFAADEEDAGREALEELCRLPPVRGQACLTLLIAERDRPGMIAEVVETDPTLTLALAEHLRQRGHDKAVTKVLTWAQDTFPNHLGVHEALVASWIRTPGGLDVLDTLSVDILARSAEESDEDTKRRMQRLGYLVQGRIAERDGRYLEARHLYQEAATLDPTRAVEPLLRAVKVLLRLDDLDRVERVLKQLYRAIEPKDRLSRVSYHRVHSTALMREGHLREAAAELHKAIRLSPKDYTLYERLGSVLAALSDGRGAERAQKQASRLRGEPSP